MVVEMVRDLLIRFLKFGLPRASGGAVSAAYQALFHSAHVFRRSSETSGGLSHPWVIGDAKLDYWVLDGQLVEVRDRVASRKFRKHIDVVRSSLHGVWTERAVGRAVVSHERHVVSAAELDHKSKSREKAKLQVAHAQSGAAAVEQALKRLARLSKRV